MLFGVLLFVFTKVFRLGSSVPNYPVLLLLNIVLFTFLQEATGAAVDLGRRQEGIVRKTQFPRLVIPLSVVLTAFFNLGAQPDRGLRLHPRLRRRSDLDLAAAAADPGAVIAVITVALSMLLSALYVRFRDVSIIWGGGRDRALLRDADPLPDREGAGPVSGFSILWNPLAPIFEQARAWIIDPSAPGAVSAAGGFAGLLPAIAIYIAVCVAGVLVFRREAPRIAEAL